MRRAIILGVLFVSIIANASDKPITVKDFAGWKRTINRQISDDGKIVMYEISPLRGDDNLIVHNLSTNKTDTIQRATEARFVNNGEKIVYRIKVPEDTIRKHKIAKTKKELLPKDDFGTYTVSTGKQHVFRGLKNFSTTEENGNTIAVLLEKTAEKKNEAKNDSTAKKPSKKAKSAPSEKDRELYDLLILNSKTDSLTRFQRVESYTVARKADAVALFSKMNDSSKINVIVRYDPLKMKADTLLKDSASVRKLTFDNNGTQLAYLASRDTAKVKNYSLYLHDLQKNKSATVADTTTFASGKLAPSENGNIFFSDNGKKLFFGLATKAVNEPKDTVPDDEKPRLDLWSYTDTQIQPKQLKNVEADKKKTFLAVCHTDNKKCIQLTDSTMEGIRLINKNNGDIALGIDRKPYERSEVWDADIPADYYLVDIKTGNRRSLLKKTNQVALSPSGNYAIWFNDETNKYVAIQTKTLQQTELLSDFKFSLTDEENDIPALPKPYGITGWSENDEFIYINDRYDIWKTDLKGRKKAENITQGRALKTKFSYIKTDNEEEFIPLNKPVLVQGTNEISFREGFYQLPVSGKIQTLIEGDFSVGEVIKAKKADICLWSTQTVKDYPEVLYSKTDFKNPQKLSVTNPQQKDFNWTTVELTKWISFDGDTLRGLLYKPENFDPNKKYPLMVYFYERNSENFHRHNIPSPSRSIISIPHYCSNGYMVFVPDITYKTGYPGKSAYNAIVSGVYNLINTNKNIDEKHMGLQGQSWGGYQTAYLVTQTNLFAAAMAGAPVSNMTSAYGGIRWGTGNSRMFQYELTQSRIGGTLWDKPLFYIENSPLFFAPKVETPLLIMSNDNDGAVPWYQGIEMFMALYRLNKPVWMLNYNGMEHNIEEKYWANRMDLTIRMMDFFDHYLKGKAAPDWMINGIPAIDKGKNPLFPLK